MIAIQDAALGLFVVVVFLVFRRLRAQINISAIRGPPSPSWLLGHQYMLRHVENVGSCEAAWYREYGAVCRISGVFSAPVLLVGDPKALHYILQTSTYQFSKTSEALRVSERLFGHGSLLIAGADDHQRMRRIMNTAFSATQLRTYLDLFQATGWKLTDKLNQVLAGEPKTVNIVSWTQKVALDIIGITSFRYHFDALDNPDTTSTMRKTMQNIVLEAQAFPSALAVVFSQGINKYIPQHIFDLLTRLPTRENRHSLSFRHTMEETARRLYYQQLNLLKAGVMEGDKEIVDILAQSSLSPDEKKRMSEYEIICQLATFIFAGHETTASTIGWMLYELSLHSEDQAEIRAEIQRHRNTGGALAASDYDSMDRLNACIKETLRLHPFVHTVFRQAEHDDMIPLSEPVITLDGKLQNEIPIAKGQTIHVSVWTYNRNPLVWGKDANEWNPKRFLDNDKDNSLGVYANLLTFSAGVRACIGWKFAVMEIQTIISELLSSFQFSIPKERPTILAAAGHQVMFPLVKGRVNEGTQIPLHISPLKQNS